MTHKSCIICTVRSLASFLTSAKNTWISSWVHPRTWVNVATVKASNPSRNCSMLKAPISFCKATFSNRNSLKILSLGPNMLLPFLGLWARFREEVERLYVPHLRTLLPSPSVPNLCPRWLNDLFYRKPHEVARKNGWRCFQISWNHLGSSSRGENPETQPSLQLLCDYLCRSAALNCSWPKEKLTCRLVWAYLANPKSSHTCISNGWNQKAADGAILPRHHQLQIGHSAAPCRVNPYKLRLPKWIDWLPTIAVV